MKQSSKIRVANTSEAECRIVNGTQNACSETIGPPGKEETLKTLC